MNYDKEIILIKEVVAEYFKLTPDVFTTKGRKGRIPEARRIAIIIANELFAEITYAELSVYFYPNMDHTTIIYARRKIKDDCETIMGYRAKFNEVAKSCEKAISTLNKEYYN
jgi:chromosomal replication initiation ATPase DnaA